MTSSSSSSLVASKRDSLAQSEKSQAQHDALLIQCTLWQRPVLKALLDAINDLDDIWSLMLTSKRFLELIDDEEQWQRRAFRT